MPKLFPKNVQRHGNAKFKIYIIKMSRIEKKNNR